MRPRRAERIAKKLNEQELLDVTVEAIVYTSIIIRNVIDVGRASIRRARIYLRQLLDSLVLEDNELVVARIGDWLKLQFA